MTGPGTSDSMVDERYRRHVASVPANDDGPIWVAALMTKDSATANRDPSRVDDRVVFRGRILRMLHGEPRPWTTLTITKYPTRRAFSDRAIKAFADGTMQELRLGDLLLFACIPTPSMAIPSGIDVPSWDDVPHPSTADDGPVSLVALHRYNDSGFDPDGMAAYASAHAAVSTPLGARPTRNFAVEGVLVGQNQDWDDLRITRYPSAAAVQTTVAEGTVAYETYCAPMVADHYVLLVRPSVDRIIETLHD